MRKLYILLLFITALSVTIFACSDDGLDTTADGDSDSEQEVADTENIEVEEQSETDETESDAEQTPKTMVEMVNPFIGSGGDGFGVGSGLPGPTAPFGMVKVSPDTGIETGRFQAYHCSGYWYGDDLLLGISHTHLYGVGAWGLGNILFMPIPGPVTESQIWEEGYWSPFKKENENSSVAYYSVIADNGDIKIEVTATERCGYQRYTFPESGASKEGFVVVDLGAHVPGGGGVDESEIIVNDDQMSIKGYVHEHGSFSGGSGGVRIYFYGMFSEKFSSVNTWNGKELKGTETPQTGDRTGVILGFDVSENTPIETKVGISYVSVEQAKLNLDTEIADWDFEKTRQKTVDQWAQELSVLSFDGGTEDQRTIMATALFHAFFMPDLFTDVNGKYRGFDLEVHEAKDFLYYTNFSMWDTYRTQHPLLVLLKPERQRDMVLSLMAMADQGGYVPKWAMCLGDSNCMIGDPGASVIADSYVKGITGFDAEKAYNALMKTAMAPTEQGSGYEGRGGIEDYIKLGYIPNDTHGSTSVARVLEFSVNDFGLANMAEALGKTDDAKMFFERSKNYKNVWHDKTKFFIGRNEDGSFVEDFDEFKWEKFYTEGNAWQYLWLVPHDPKGLMDLFGSAEAMEKKLETFFIEADKEFKERPPELAMLPPTYYWHGNEPDIHAAYMFLQVGRPDLTQKWVRWIMKTLYNPTFNGIPGNDDCGTMSAWYVFSAMGFYPMPGSDLYFIGSPIFEKIEINLKQGKFTVEAKNTSAENMYVKSVTLNGKALEKPWFKHAEFKDGGSLVFEMTDTPTEWGKTTEDPFAR